MPEHTPPVEIAVLGPLLLRVHGEDRPMSSGKQRTLLARLVVDAGHVVGADQLIDALWGETPPTTADKNLHVLIGRLRRVLGADAITTGPGGYRLALATICDVDAIRFEQLASFEGRDSGATVSEVIDALDRAASLWRGPVAAELRTPWGLPRVARWTEQRQQAMERSLALRALHGPSTELIDTIRVEIAHHPHRESLRVALIDALRTRGDVSGARMALVDAIRDLNLDVGLAESARIRELATELGVHDVIDRSESAFDPSTAQVIDSLGQAFDVQEALSLARDAGIEDAAFLDRLETLLERGLLRRAVAHDGRATLIRREVGE